MEAVNIDNLAKLITFSSYANANSDTNIDIVNPIPVSNATSIIDIHEAVSGFSAICSLVAIKLNDTTPSGFPITKPHIIPIIKFEASATLLLKLIAIEVLANANKGNIIKLQSFVSLCSSISDMDSPFLSLLDGITTASNTPLIVACIPLLYVKYHKNNPPKRYGPIFLIFNILFNPNKTNKIIDDIISAFKFIFAEYKNTMAKIEIKSSTTANDSRNIFRFEFSLDLNIIKIPIAKAISVDMATPTPGKYSVFLFITIKIIAGTITPPKEAITGKDAFLKLDNDPSNTSFFISNPTYKKNIAIIKSFMIICKLKLPIRFV